jgi:hypothetical protein
MIGFYGYSNKKLRIIIMTKLIQRQTISENKIKIGDASVTPQMQSVMLGWPYGRLVWNRPIAIVLEQDNQATRIPITDITRILIGGFLGLGLFFAMATILLSFQQRRKNHER